MKALLVVAALAAGLFAVMWLIGRADKLREKKTGADLDQRTGGIWTASLFGAVGVGGVFVTWWGTGSDNLILIAIGFCVALLGFWMAASALRHPRA